MDPNPSNDGKSSRSYALSGKIMLSAIVVLFTVVLLILFLHLYVRWHVIRRASRRVRRRRRLVFAAEGHAPTPCAINRGLDPSILASLPVLLFSDHAEEDDESGECAVCLNEFKEGQKIRYLPQCSHRFHIDCIDMWFCSHSTCPLCRADVEVVKDAASTTSCGTPEVDTLAAPADSNGNELCSSCQRVEEMGSSSSDSGYREVRIEIPASRAEGSSGQEEQISLGLELPEEQPLKSASSRMVLIRWLLMRDPRLYWGGVSGSEPDLEHGDGESPPPPPPTTAADPTR